MIVQDTVYQLQRFINAMATYHDQCYGVMKQVKIFPLEVDLSQDAFAYNTGIYNTGDNENDSSNSEFATNIAQNGSSVNDVKLIDLGDTVTNSNNIASDDTILGALDGNSDDIEWSRAINQKTIRPKETVDDLLFFD